MKHLSHFYPLFLFLCLNLVISFAMGQYSRRIGKGTIGQMEIGASFLDITNFNQALEAQQYLPLKETFFALGIGIDRFVKNRFLIGGSLYNYMINQSLANNQLAILGYHYGTLRTGVVLFQEYESFMVYPSIGLGYGLANFKERPADEPLPIVHWAGGATADARLTAQLFSLLGEEHLVSLGFHAGYLYTLDKSWNLSNFDPDTSGLSVSPQGLYFRVSLGMALWKR